MIRLVGMRRGRKMAVIASAMLLAVMLAGAGSLAPATPAHAADPTIDQQLDELQAEIDALVAAFPAMANDAAIATDELLNTAWEFVFGTWCSMAAPLQRAVNALDHAESIAPASIKPMILAVSSAVFGLEAYVVSLSEVDCDTPDVFHVDPAVRPTIATGKDDMDGSTLSMGALMDSDGIKIDLVANRILLETNDNAKVTAFINRFGGTKVDTLLAEAGTEGGVNLHTIRMDPARLLTTSQLAADLAALDPGYSGEVFLASDQGTLRLLATAVRAQREGYEVSLDFLMLPDDIAGGFTSEVPQSSHTPWNWVPDAFSWPWMRDNVGGQFPQDIEVTTAWQMLRNAGKLQKSVNVGVIDWGFDPAFNRDFPSPTTGYLSGVATVAFGNKYDYHGTKVANAFAGQVDNGIGAAGPGGPVVNHMYTVDFGVGSLRAWTRALRKLRWRDTNVKIINMSVSYNPLHRFARVAGRGGLDRELKRIADDGALVFVSAGNDGENTDTVRCGRVTGRCRERRIRMPCELARTICVGGLDVNSMAKAANSNWGDTDVNIWGPYNVWTGQTSSCPVDPPSATPQIGSYCSVQWVSGTSFSSPFVAGVAALIWAANPALTKDQVWDIMQRTATPVNNGGVTRVVHAARAMVQALPPVVAVNSPTPNQVFPSGATIPGVATITTGRGAPSSVTWIVGEVVVGRGTNVNIRLSNGTHTILVIAQWPDGVRAGTSVTVRVGP